MNAKTIIMAVFTTLLVGVGVRYYCQSPRVEKPLPGIMDVSESASQATLPAAQKHEASEAVEAIDEKPAETNVRMPVADQRGENRTTSQAPAVTIQAEGIAMLPATLQRRFPAARTIEPVKLDSLANLLARRQADGAQDPITTLGLPAPNDRVLIVDIQKQHHQSPRRGTFTGTVKGISQSQVVVAYCEDVVTASVIIPGKEHIEIAYAGNDTHVLLEIDPARILPNAPPLIPPVELAGINFP